MGAMKRIATLKVEIGLGGEHVDEVKSALIKHMLTHIARGDGVMELATLFGLQECTREQLAAMVCVTKAQAVALTHGEVLHHVNKRNRDGSPMRARVSGRCKTWVAPWRQQEFRLPVKHGMYDSGYIDENNAGEWYVA